MQKFYDDPDFVLTRAQAKEIEQAQAEALQDLDPVPQAAVVSKTQLLPAVAVPAPDESTSLAGTHQQTPAASSENLSSSVHSGSDPSLALAVGAPGDSVDEQVSPDKSSVATPEIQQTSSAPAAEAGPKAGLQTAQAEVAAQPETAAPAETAAQSKATPAKGSLNVDSSVTAHACTDTVAAALPSASPAATGCSPTLSPAKAAMRLLGTSKTKQGDALKDSSSNSPQSQSVGMRALASAKARHDALKRNSFDGWQALSPTRAAVGLLRAPKAKQGAHDAESAAPGPDQKDSPSDVKASQTATAAQDTKVASGPPQSPAPLFVPQSPIEDRAQVKKAWIAHHVVNLGWPAETAEAGKLLHVTIKELQLLSPPCRSSPAVCA